MTDSERPRTATPSPSLVPTIPAIALLLVCVVHVFRSRSLGDIGKNSLLVGVFLAILGIALGLRDAIKDARTRYAKTVEQTGSETVFLVAGIVVGIGSGMFVLGLSFYSCGVGLIDLIEWITKTQFFRESAGTLLAEVFVIVAGILLFWFRLRHRSFYGLTEALVGLSIAAQKVHQQGFQNLPRTDVALVLLTASVYLFVRGLDNVHQGIYGRDKDPWMVWMTARLRGLW